MGLCERGDLRLHLRLAHTVANLVAALRTLTGARWLGATVVADVDHGVVAAKGLSTRLTDNVGSADGAETHGFTSAACRASSAARFFKSTRSPNAVMRFTSALNAMTACANSLALSSATASKSGSIARG